ncbi:hypothetical protein B9W61_22460 [Streptomyces sp. CS057]|nr:hypothetical protein B9W61_22460 [Streptomyces sp. CS057]
MAARTLGTRLVLAITVASALAALPRVAHAAVPSGPVRATTASRRGGGFLSDGLVAADPQLVDGDLAPLVCHLAPGYPRCPAAVFEVSNQALAVRCRTRLVLGGR